MAIKRVSDLEKYAYDPSTGPLSAFLDSPEYLYSCIEVSQNKNGDEHSQFQSMRMDIADLHQYMDYNIINNDIVFEGNKSFTNKVLMNNGAEIYGNFAVRNNSGTNTATIDASTIQLSSRNQLKLNAVDTDLSSKNLTLLRSKNLQLSAQENIQLSANAGSISCNAENTIVLDTPKSSGTVLSGKAERIIFDVGEANVDKFIIKVNDDKIMWSDGYNIFHFAQPINAVALSARWADLAEYYVADKPYKPGTLVKFGGKYELTIADTEANAVVTTKPGFILNSGIEQVAEDSWPIAVALVGRTPIKVIGKVSKFQNLMLSEIPGIACISDGSKPTIGKALEDKLDDEASLVECVVNLRL